jgi:hypothetical protein
MQNSIFILTIDPFLNHISVVENTRENEKAPQYHFLFFTGRATLPGIEVRLTCEEIKKIRGGT